MKQQFIQTAGRSWVLSHLDDMHNTSEISILLSLTKAIPAATDGATNQLSISWVFQRQGWTDARSNANSNTTINSS